jgi:hypothetical protein
VILKFFLRTRLSILRLINNFHAIDIYRFSIYVKVSEILTWLQKQLSSVASVKEPSIVVEVHDTRHENSR